MFVLQIARTLFTTSNLSTLTRMVANNPEFADYQAKIAVEAFDQISDRSRSKRSAETFVYSGARRGTLFFAQLLPKSAVSNFPVFDLEDECLRLRPFIHVNA